MSAFIDGPGLTRQANPEPYAKALQLEGQFVASEHERLPLLRKLRHGAGATVYTGPEGAEFWRAASWEVRIRIVPDGTELQDRCEPDLEWALRATGVRPVHAKKLAARTEPPHRGQWVEPYKKATGLLRAYRTTPKYEPIIVRQFAASTVTDFGEQVQLLHGLRDERLVSLDYEYDRDDHSRTAGIAVSTEDGNWYLATEAADLPRRPGHAEALRETVGLWLGGDTPSVWHNGKSDFRNQLPYDPIMLVHRPINDTLVMAYLVGIDITGPDLGLKELTRTLLDRDPLDHPGDSLINLPLELGARYAAAGDSRNTFDLYYKLRDLLAERGQLGLYEDIERPVMPIVASMEKYGQPIDHDELRRVRDDFIQMEDGLRALWQSEEGVDIADPMGIREIVKRRAGYDPHSVAKDTLAKIEEPWMDSIMAYRQIVTQRGFVERHLQKWEAAGQPVDFRAYSYFNQAGGAQAHDPRSFKRAPRSGRFSSSGDFGNLQNQPRSIRDIFIAPPGHAFWSFDYSQLEVRIAAALSGDVNMLAVLNDPDGDIHGDFKARILMLTGVDVPRSAAKQGIFSGAYGGHVDILRSILAKERAFPAMEELEAIVAARERAYPQYYSEYVPQQEALALSLGYSETMWGRRRYDADIYSPDGATKSHAQRAMVNHTIQGTAADILKVAMVLAVPVLLQYNAHLSMQVHDELCGWVPLDKAEAFKHDMEAVMESIPVPGLTLRVSGGYGRSWEDVK